MSERGPRRSSRPGCVARLLLAIALTTVALGAVAAAQYRAFTTTDVVLGAEPVRVEIGPGWSSFRAVAELEAAGVIAPSPFWDVYLRLAAVDCLQAGTHAIEGAATAEELMAALCAPSYAPGVRLTLVEGQNIFELADEMDSVGLGQRDDVLALAFSPEFLESVGIDAPSVEGYLAPDTYEFAVDSTAEDVLRRLLSAGAELRASVFATETEVSGSYTLHEVLTMASIVEREAQVGDERALIARVLLNRLDAGMPLQCDPTCVYGPTLYRQRPSPTTCRDPSSTHSTYVVPGLPPTPIANPRAASISAVLEPAADDSVLYFVARMDGTGRHEFSATYEEHRRNVRRFLGGQ